MKKYFIGIDESNGKDDSCVVVGDILENGVYQIKNIELTKSMEV